MQETERTLLGPAQLLEAAFQVAQRLRRRIGPEGFPVTLLRGDTGKVIDARPLVCDLGDYAPFVAFLGLEGHQEEMVDWALEQGRLTLSLFQRKEGFFSFPEERETSFRPVWVDRWGDTLLGLVLLFDLTGDSALRSGIQRFLEFLKGYTGPSGGVARAFFRVWKKKLKIPIACPSYAGTYAEECLIFSGMLEDPAVPELAARLVSFWSGHPYFARYGLFPSRSWTPLSPSYRMGGPVVGPFRPFVESEIAKLNSNMVHALLELYRLTQDSHWKEPLRRWFSSARRQFSRAGGLYSGFWSPSKGGRGAVLAQNIPMLNLLLDGSIVLKDAALRESALEGLAFWMEHQTGLGFFPEDPWGRTFFERRSLLDCQTDLIVVLLKAFCLERNERYLTAAQRAVRAVLRYFQTEEALVWSVKSDTGEKVCPTIHLKFIGLLLKPLLLMKAVLEGRDILSERQLYLLSRDR